MTQARKANHSIHEPPQGYFSALPCTGEKAVKYTHESNLSGSILKIIDNAKKYAKGRIAGLELKSAHDDHHVEKSATMKTTN